jgi:hypothetical protein
MGSLVNKSTQLMRRMGEGVAILVSILIAFGIDAAWERSGEREEESRILSALHAEFVVNQEILADKTAFHTALRGAAFDLLEAARPGAPSVQASSVDEMIGRLTWWGGFWVFESASLDAVILGGNLDVIRNEGLRTLLTGWRAAVEQTERQEAPELTHAYGTWLPYLKSHTNMAQLGNVSTGIPGADEPSWYEALPDPMPQVDNRPLLDDPEFLNTLVERLWLEDSVLKQYSLLEARVTELLDALEREIQR